MHKRHDQSHLHPVLAKELTEAEKDQVMELYMRRQNKARERDVKKRLKTQRNKRKQVEIVQGTRVLVRKPPGHKSLRTERLHFAHCAVVYHVRHVNDQRLYLLQWITAGLSGETAGQLSTNLYNDWDLRPLSALIPVEDLQCLVTSKKLSKRKAAAAADTSDEEYIVDRVLAKRRVGDTFEYQVKWLEYEETTWEPWYV